MRAYSIGVQELFPFAHDASRQFLRPANQCEPPCIFPTFLHAWPESSSSGCLTAGILVYSSSPVTYKIYAGAR